METRSFKMPFKNAYKVLNDCLLTKKVIFLSQRIQNPSEDIVTYNE